MNKKGFTVVELTVSFCLAATVTVLIFQIITGFKELYIKGNIETTLITKKSNMTKIINEDLGSEEISNISSCGDECIRFTFVNTTVKDLYVNRENNTIVYDNYAIDMIEGTTVGTLNYIVDNIVTTVGTYNTILNVTIPITNRLSDLTFDIHFVYQYNNTTTTCTLS